MTKKVKKVTAHLVTQTKQASGQISFRALLTIFEVVAAVLIALSAELPTGQTVALAGAIGAAISAAVNVIKESGVLTLLDDGEVKPR